MKKYILIVVSLCLLSAIPLLLLAHRKSQEKACVQNMLNLWECGRSTALANSVPFDQVLDVTLVTNFFPHPAATPCPSTDEFYHSFRMLDGPTCPFGHQMPKELRSKWQAYMKGIYDQNGANNTQEGIAEELGKPSE